MSAAVEAGTDVEAALADLNLALRTHGGRVEYTGFHDGKLKLRMAGLCAGCLFKPITLEATIRPYIKDRLGLDVEVEGARISEEAQARIARALASSYEPPEGVISIHQGSRSASQS